MAKSKVFYNAAVVAARSVLFGLMVTGVGLLLASCAGGPRISEAIRSAPSMDAVSGLNDKLLWILSHAETGGEYAVALDSDDGSLNAASDLSFPKKSEITNVTITIKSTGGNRTVSPAHFTIGSGITLILDNITLRGSRAGDSTSGSYRRLVSVSSGGTFVMNDGSAIVGNLNNTGSGGAVYVSGGGAFFMNGGVISDNMCILGKPAIMAAINGAIIAKAGAAMLLGAASNNLPKNTMLSKGLGKASDNVAKSELKPAYPACLGGGVYVSGASSLFGKVTPAGVFVKTGGTVTGYDSDQAHGNSVYDCDVKLDINDSGIVKNVTTQYTLSNNGGHAIYFGGRESKSINKTVGPNDCFEFRDGIYRETQCGKPKTAEAVAPVPAPAPESVEPEVPEVVEPAVVEEVVAPELLAALAGTSGAVHESAEPAVQHPVQAAEPVPESAQPAHKAEATADIDEAPLPPLRNEPVIAAYVFGAKDHALNKAMTARLLVALMNTGRYQALEDYAAFFDHAVKELKNGAAPTAANAEQIKGLGERFGAEYVCVAEIVPVFGEYRVFSYILRLKTTKIAAKGNSDLPLKAMNDLTAAAEQIVESMFKKAQPSQQQPAAATPAPAASIVSADLAAKAQPVTPAHSCPPCKEPVREEAVEEEESKRKSKTGFNLGYGFSGDAGILQFGGIHIQPISEKTVSFVAEANFRLGDWNSRFEDYSEKISYYGFNVPLLFRFEKSVLFMETGAFLDALSVKDESDKGVWITNFGGVLGGGFAFNKGYTQYFYKFNYGTAYYSHIFGVRQLF